MNNNRDMFYNSYGYQGFDPNSMINQEMMPGSMPMNPGSMKPNMGLYPNMPTYPNHGNMQGSLEMRVSKLEREVRKIDARLSRLESPYGNNGPFNKETNEPNNDMYMM